MANRLSENGDSCNSRNESPMTNKDHRAFSELARTAMDEARARYNKAEKSNGSDELSSGNGDDFAALCRAKAMIQHEIRRAAREAVARQIEAESADARSAYTAKETDRDGVRGVRAITIVSPSLDSASSESNQLVQETQRRTAAIDRLREKLWHLKQSDLIVGCKSNTPNDKARSTDLRSANRLPPKAEASSTKTRPEVVTDYYRYNQIDCVGPAPTKPDVEFSSYVVQKGDTLTAIARKMTGPEASPRQVFDTVHQIARLNGIVDPNRIKEHAHILVPPAPQPIAKDELFYKVVAGDNLTSIARKTLDPNATPRAIHERVLEITKLNGLNNPNRIRPNESLKIPRPQH